MKMVLGNGKEFNVERVVDYGYLEISFLQGTSYDEVARVYDSTYSPTDYSVDALRKFDLYSDDGVLQGSHFGYTETRQINALAGNVSVQIDKENELKTEVELLKEENEKLKQAVELLMQQSMLFS